MKFRDGDSQSRRSWQDGTTHHWRAYFPISKGANAATAVVETKGVAELHARSSLSAAMVGGHVRACWVSQRTEAAIRPPLQRTEARLTRLSLVRQFLLPIRLYRQTVTHAMHASHTPRRLLKGRVLSFIVTICSGSLLTRPSLERGTYLVEGPVGGGKCHTPIGPDGFVREMALAGRLAEDLPVFTAIAPNLTSAARAAAGPVPISPEPSARGFTADGGVIGPPMPMTMYRGIGGDDVASMVMYLRARAGGERSGHEHLQHPAATCLRHTGGERGRRSG